MTFSEGNNVLLMDETNRCTGNFPFFINGTIALHVMGSFSAVSSQSPSCIKLYQSRRTADNAPDDGQKNCPKQVELLLPLINNWKIIVHLLVSSISNLRDAWSYNPKIMFCLLDEVKACWWHFVVVQL